MKYLLFIIPIIFLFISCHTNKNISQLSTKEKFNLEDKIPTDPNIIKGKLDNGITYYIRQNRKPENRAELRLAINAGSILEDENQQGLAHFVEHMCFNGTKHFKKQELIDFLESIGMRFGADINAYTSFDETVYMLELPTDSLKILDQGFLVLEDWANAVSFEEDEIEKERGVIIEEWRLGRGANARIRDKQYPVLFKDSRYAKRLPIGKKAVLDTFHYETLRRFYKDWYRTDLMAVIAVGDFEVEVVKSMIEAHFGKIPKKEKPRQRIVYPVPDHRETLYSMVSDSEATHTTFSIYYKLPVRNEITVSDYRQMIIESLYNNMFNKRLLELRKQPDPPFIFGSSGKGRFIRSKEFYVLSAMVKDNAVLRGFETLLTEAKRVQNHGFTQTELDRQKKSSLRSMERTFVERDKTESSRYVSEYIRNFLSSEPIPGIEYEFELYKKYINGISLAEVNKLTSDWIKNVNRVITVSGPKKEGVQLPIEQELKSVMDSVAVKTVEPYIDDVLDEPLLDTVPVAKEIISEKFYDSLGITECVLENGIRIFLKPTDFKNDQIIMTATSPGGLSLVADSNLVAGLTATSVLTESGLGKFNDVQLKKLLSGKVVSASTYIGQLREGFYASSSVKDIETAFQLIYLNFTAPRKDSTAFIAYRDRMKAMIKNKSLNPESAYSDTINVTLTQHHPRYKPWDSERLDKMDLDKSLNIYRDRFADASDFTVFIVGNFNLEKIKPLIKTYFGGLPVLNRNETWKDVSFEYPKGIIKKAVYRGKEPKSKSILIFSGDFEWNRRNRHVTNTMLDILRIKLREKIREDLGGTYSVQVGGSYPHYPNPEYQIDISFGSDPERVDELKSAIFTQIDSLKNFPVNESYLNKVKEINLSEYETSLKRNRFWLNNMEYKFYHGEDMMDILNYRQLVESVTLNEIQQAAKKYFNMDNYVQVTLYPENWKN